MSGGGFWNQINPIPRFPTLPNPPVHEGIAKENGIMMVVAFHFLVAELENLRQASLREGRKGYTPLDRTSRSKK